MNDIQIFKNDNFGEVRVVMNEANEPMFCAKDIATALGYADTADAITRHCKSGKKVFHPHNNGVGGVNVVYIPEKDVYRLIMRSNLPEAEKFQDWVCDEVLPSIRKTGGYIATKADDTPEMIMARAVLVAQATIDKQSKQIAEQSAKIEADAPKVLFADAVVGSRSTCLIGELAKILTQNGYKIGQNRLFKWLREKGYLGTKGEYYNIPNQQYQEMGLFEVKTTVHDEHGVMVTKRTPKVTGKGQSYFINKFLGNAAVL